MRTAERCSIATIKSGFRPQFAELRVGDELCAAPRVARHSIGYREADGLLIAGLLVFSA